MSGEVGLALMLALTTVVVLMLLGAFYEVE